MNLKEVTCVSQDYFCFLLPALHILLPSLSCDPWRLYSEPHGGHRQRTDHCVPPARLATYAALGHPRFGMLRENIEAVEQNITRPPVPAQVECSVFSKQENNHLINNMP